MKVRLPAGTIPAKKAKLMLGSFNKTDKLDACGLNLQQGASELIRQQGAFPDQSIISAYEAAPALNKLPDYVVACAIEKIL